MKLYAFIFVLLAASFGLRAGAQDSAPALNSGTNLPAPDLLNVTGTDRATPLSKVGIAQKLNSQLPLNTLFKDENGVVKPLGSYFGKRPVVLALVYYNCPMLCSQVLTGVVRALRVLTFDPGKDFDVVVVSFDARETANDAARGKAIYTAKYGRPATNGGWHFL